ncbi:MAG: 50S ribosomal protein L4 [Candidatus Peribacteria bacterium]|nr:MAG: 50S ribosomal protein L4 [Candidatus Peribacteria bacterium]
MAYTITLYDQKGKEAGTVQLNKDLYNKDVINTDLIHEYVVLQQANKRQSSAHTKTRGEVAGSGKKLYRQKGTGNARVGDGQSPIRVGGGVTFGPSNEKNYTKKMNKKMRRKAMCGVLSLKAEEKEIAGFKAFALKAPKTKDAVAFLDAAGFANKKVLLVVNESDENLERSFANIPTVKQVRVQYLNPVDVMQAHIVLIAEDAFDTINS